MPGDPIANIGTNESGDRQKALDIVAYHHPIDALRGVSVARVISEEAEDVITLAPNGQFDVAMDPIDGSGSIGIGAHLGALFCIFPAGETFLRSGRDIIAAGYVSFGHSTDIGWSLSDGAVAKATAEELGNTATVSAHKGDTNIGPSLIDAAIADGSKAIILDPANADGSVGVVRKATDAGIPLFLVNAEINQAGIAKAQLVSNNAQGAAIGAVKWVELVGDTAKCVEFFGNPADSNAATRSNGYNTVLSQYPGLEKVAQEVAN